MDSTECRLFQSVCQIIMAGAEWPKPLARRGLQAIAEVIFYARHSLNPVPYRGWISRIPHQSHGQEVTPFGPAVSAPHYVYFHRCEEQITVAERQCNASNLFFENIKFHILLYCAGRFFVYSFTYCTFCTSSTACVLVGSCRRVTSAVPGSPRPSVTGEDNGVVLLSNSGSMHFCRFSR